MKRRTAWFVAGAAAVAIASAFAYWNSRKTYHDILAGSIPPQPSFDGWPAEFADRVQACEERIRSDSGAVGALGELSRLYHANGFYAQATLCYEALERLEPRDPTWLHRHAIILAGFGDTVNAASLWEKVVRLSPRYTPARLRLGDIQLIQNRMPEARAAYQSVLELEPDNAYAKYGLARCEMEAGEAESALRLLEEVVAQTNFRLGYDLIVTLLEELGRDSRAAAIRGQHKASGAYRDPFDPWMDALYADCYDAYRLSLAAGATLEAGKTAEAIQRLERGLKLSPGNISLHFQLGSTHLTTGALTKAREQFEACTRLDPKFPDGWAQLSDLYERLGQADRAAASLAEGLAHCPDSPGLHLMRARRFKRQRDLEAAIDAFETSIRLRPNEADAYIELATLYFESDRSAEGVEQLRRGLEAEPGHPVALSTLALNAIISGNEQNARQWMGRAGDQPRIDREQMDSLKAAFREKFGREWVRSPP